MNNEANAELIQLLTEDDAERRMLALHWLCEGYAREEAVNQAVFAGWDRWGPSAAFYEFPMLTHFPVAHERVAEVCQRAQKLVADRKLTDPASRCAGKMLEQTVQLPATVLEPHLGLLESTVSKSKIFFRVDLAAVRERVAMLAMSADELAGQLDQALAMLLAEPEDDAAARRAAHALEALRRQHASYMDLTSVLGSQPPAEGPQALSFRVTLQSLCQLEQAGLESSLGTHLLDSRESVFIPTVEALVRTGSTAAAATLIEHYPLAAESNQQWIARGLQRIRVKGLADDIARLRAGTEEPRRWIMLLAAEVRQMDPASSQRLIAELARLPMHSTVLINALLLYAHLHAESEDAQPFRAAILQYLARANESLQTQLEQSPPQTASPQLASTKTADRRARERAREQALKRFRKRK